MKRLACLLITACLMAASYGQNKISEYPNTASIAGTDLILLSSGSTNKNISWTQVRAILDAAYIALSGTNASLAGNLSLHSLNSTGVVTAASFQGSGDVSDSALALPDDDGSHFFSIESAGTTTTDVNMVGPAAPFTGLAKYTATGTNWVISQAVAGTDYMVPSVYDYPLILQRSSTLIDVNSTTDETAIFTNSIPAGIMGTARAVRLILEGDWLANSGTPTIVFKVYHGSTVIYTDTSAAFSASSARMPVRIDLRLGNQDSASAQLMNALLVFGRAGTATVGTGDLSSNSILINNIEADSAENSAVAQPLSITVTFSVNNAAVQFRTRRTTLLLE